MKRIGCIFDKVVEYDNLRLAFFRASRGKRCRDDQIRFGMNLDRELDILRRGLVDCDYPIG
ncbi:MAG: RNA-dependent DNA polymerase, partial [Kiritimatiellae bacterium]|nr:RNA-dependent DNA polymerase [Kiritimatiellia bacterium]